MWGTYEKIFDGNLFVYDRHLNIIFRDLKMKFLKKEKQDHCSSGAKNDVRLYTLFLPIYIDSCIHDLTLTTSYKLIYMSLAIKNTQVKTFSTYNLSIYLITYNYADRYRFTRINDLLGRLTSQFKVIQRFNN